MGKAFFDRSALKARSVASSVAPKGGAVGTIREALQHRTAQVALGAAAVTVAGSIAGAAALEHSGVIPSVGPGVHSPAPIVHCNDNFASGKVEVKDAHHATVQFVTAPAKTDPKGTPAGISTAQSFDPSARIVEACSSAMLHHELSGPGYWSDKTQDLLAKTSDYVQVEDVIQSQMGDARQIEHHYGKENPGLYQTIRSTYEQQMGQPAEPGELADYIAVADQVTAQAQAQAQAQHQTVDPKVLEGLVQNAVTHAVHGTATYQQALAKAAADGAVKAALGRADDGTWTKRGLAIVAGQQDISPGDLINILTGQIRGSETIGPGVVYHDDGAVKVLEVDLDNPLTHVGVSGDGFKTVADHAAALHAFAALNGAEFAPGPPCGFQRADGVTNPQGYPDGDNCRASIGITADGHAYLFDSKGHEHDPNFVPQYVQVDTGEGNVMKDGQLVWDNPGKTELGRDCTVVGISRDGTRLIWIAINDGSCSIDLMHQMLAKYGAYNAVEQDGGGSTKMWVAGKGYVNNEVEDRQMPTVFYVKLANS